MSQTRSQSRVELQRAYRVRLLCDVQCGPRGISHGAAAERDCVPWPAILRARAAEVGEPEGVRTIVFDLVVGSDDSGLEVIRFDADPGESAMRVARQLSQALGPERSGASIKSVAVDGVASRWYPDLESLARDGIRTEGR